MPAMFGGGVSPSFLIFDNGGHFSSRVRLLLAKILNSLQLFSPPWALFSRTHAIILNATVVARKKEKKSNFVFRLRMRHKSLAGQFYLYAMRTAPDEAPEPSPLGQSVGSTAERGSSTVVLPTDPRLHQDPPRPHERPPRAGQCAAPSATNTGGQRDVAPHLLRYHAAALGRDLDESRGGEDEYPIDAAQWSTEEKAKFAVELEELELQEAERLLCVAASPPLQEPRHRESPERRRVSNERCPGRAARRGRW
jgi:hypothetical protein